MQVDKKLIGWNKQWLDLIKWTYCFSNLRQLIARAWKTTSIAPILVKTDFHIFNYS